jgi:hypothetical protein
LLPVAEIIQRTVNEFAETIERLRTTYLVGDAT